MALTRRSAPAHTRPMHPESRGLVLSFLAACGDGDIVDGGSTAVLTTSSVAPTTGAVAPTSSVDMSSVDTSSVDTSSGGASSTGEPVTSAPSGSTTTGESTAGTTPVSTRVPRPGHAMTSSNSLIHPQRPVKNSAR